MCKELDEWVVAVREQMPVLNRRIDGVPLVYLDNAATTQVPESVIEAIAEHMRCSNANVHRGAHALSVEATEAFEHARETVRRFLNARSASEVTFTSGTTESLNALARGLEHVVEPGDVVLVTQMEHHSNLVPWQMLCKRTGARLHVAPLLPNGDLDVRAIEGIFEEGQVRIFAFSAVSNVTGAVNPIRELSALSRMHGALSIVDAAQAVRGIPLDMQDIGCDFLCFSGHKMCAPTGIGVLYGNEKSLELLEPSKYGGGMVEEVAAESSTFAKAPYGLEGGTPNIQNAVGLARAIDWMLEMGSDRIHERESVLTQQLVEQLRAIDKVRILGNPEQRIGVVSIVAIGLHPYDLAVALDNHGVAVRSGHHCAQPHHDFFGADSSLRFSPAFYNTEDELAYATDSLVAAIRMLDGLGSA